MGFGSYDESEQEQPKADDEDIGEDYTRKIKGKPYEGESKTEPADMKDLLENL